MTKEVNYTYKAILLINIIQLAIFAFGYGGRFPKFDNYEVLSDLVYGSNHLSWLHHGLLQIIYYAGIFWAGKIVVAFNILGTMGALYLVAKHMGLEKKNIALLLLVVFSYLPFIKMLAGGNLFGLYMLVLAMAICLSERIWLRAVLLYFACLMNGKTCFILFFMAFSGALNISIICSVLLGLSSIIYFPLVGNVFKFGWGNLPFSFNNNASFMAFPAYAYAVISSKSGELFPVAMIEGKDIGYKMFISLFLTVLTTEIIRVRNHKKVFDSASSQIAHILLFIAFIGLYPHWVSMYELSIIAVFMLPLLSYLHVKNIACKACVYGFGAFFTIAGLGLFAIIPILRELNMLSCFMLGVWGAAINIREYKKNIY